MKISVVLNAHGNTELVSDTVDAIQKWVSHEILMIIDGSSWENWGKSLKLPVAKLNGFYHGCNKAPYRNVALALNQVTKTFPNSDWYAYVEYDVLFTSDSFKEDLIEAKKRNVWCLGSDFRIKNVKVPILEAILQDKIKGPGKYLLGSCVFYSGEFLRALSESFFERFLYYTNDFISGHFPGYEGVHNYDFSEYLYPTLANHFGGNVEEFKDKKKYLIRWKPEIEEIFPETAIIHPSKTDLIRFSQRIKRHV